jgi:hypothetical protein
VYKDLLSKDELTALLTPGREALASQGDSLGERGGDHKDLAYQFLLESVRELQKEVSRLRLKVEALEKRNAPRKAPAALVVEPAPIKPQASEPDPAVGLSRLERHGAKKGKWF